MLFGKNKAISDIAGLQIDEEHYRRIENWKLLYSGRLDLIHKIEVFSIEKGKHHRIMKSLKMPKVSAEYIAKLIFTEKIQINVSNKQHETNLNQLLDDSRFMKEFPLKVEQMFALGGLILKGHPEADPNGEYKININYISPDNFIPTAYENGIVTEGIFINTSRDKDKIYYLMEFHEWKWDYPRDENGNATSEELVKKLVIKNKLYESTDRDQMMKEIPLATRYPDLKQQVTIEGLTQPIFTYLKPAIANNYDVDSPLGISLYGNSLDTLELIDTAFDSFHREFKLGKRRIIVPYSAVTTVVDPVTHEQRRFFDADDEAYVAMNYDDAQGQKVSDNTVSIRVEDHVAAINALLNIYAMQIGLSSGTFIFNGQGIKTATEVVSEKSDTYQTKQKNENLIEEGLQRFFKSLMELADLYDALEVPASEFEAEFYWDDSIIKDKYTETDFQIKLVQNKLQSKVRAIMQIFDVSEEEALEIMEQIKTEDAAEMPEDEVDEDGGDIEEEVEITNVAASEEDTTNGQTNARTSEPTNS